MRRGNNADIICERNVELVGGTMRRYGQLKQQYEELSRSYARLYEEHAELAYQYRQIQGELAEKEQQSEEVYTLHQSGRKLKHDMKNHLMVLSSYLASENYDEARAYASQILDKLNAMHSYIETGNTLLNHIINEKFQYAREQGIEIKAQIENLSFASMSSLDFAALLGNMLDNAIEASLREAEHGRELELQITKKQGYETICVKNRIAVSVLTENPELRSTKEEEGDIHGIGISRIKEIAENYHGMYDVYEMDGFFCIAVFIPA